MHTAKASNVEGQFGPLIDAAIDRNAQARDLRAEDVKAVKIQVLNNLISQLREELTKLTH